MCIRDSPWSGGGDDNDKKGEIHLVPFLGYKEVIEKLPFVFSSATRVPTAPEERLSGFCVACYGARLDEVYYLICMPSAESLTNYGSK